jgi:transposase
VAQTTAANVNDVTRFVPVIDAVPSVRGRRGRPRRRPKEVYGDRAYHSRSSRRELRLRRVKVRVARPKDPHGSGLGRRRWVVERTISWLHQHRRLRVRYERRADIHEALLTIGCCLICFKQLQTAGAL